MSDDDEKTGYGRPPKHSRFEKGKSGNPKGRPKGGKNFSTVMQDELNEKVTVNIGNARQRLTKLQVVIKRQSAKAMQGDPKAAAIILAQALRLDADKADETPALGPDVDELILKYAPDVLADLQSKLLPEKEDE